MVEPATAKEIVRDPETHAIIGYKDVEEGSSKRRDPFPFVLAASLVAVVIGAVISISFAQAYGEAHR